VNLRKERKDEGQITKQKPGESGTINRSQSGVISDVHRNNGNAECTPLLTAVVRVVLAVVEALSGQVDGYKKCKKYIKFGRKE